MYLWALARAICLARHVVVRREASATRALALIAFLTLPTLLVFSADAHAAVTIDHIVSADGNGTTSTQAFSTSASSELVVAFAASDGPDSGGQTLSISGAGLAWSLVRRASAQAGTSEIWMATAPAIFTNVTVTSTQSVGGFHQSLTVVAFTGASGVGSSASTSAANGAPGAVLTTTQSGSLVFGVGNDWDNAIARTVAADQTMIHQAVDTSVNDTYWVQRATAPIAAAGTLVAVADSAPITDRWNFAAVEIVAGQAPTGTQTGATIDQLVSADGSGSTRTQAFSTSSPGELIVAFAASDGPASGGQTLTVRGAGLTWTLVRRANARLGTSEIWTATAPPILSNVIVTSTQRVGGYHQSLTVITFTGAAGVGASASAGAADGAPGVLVTTTQAGSLVYGVGNDWDSATARTVGANQAIVHQWVETASGDTFWVQARTAAIASAGTPVQINDTAPTRDQWNITAVEIVPRTTTAAPTITVTLSPAPNANGWNNTVVTAHFTCLEAGAPLPGCPADREIASEGPNQTVTGTVTDAAGNTASVTSDPFSLDLHGPTVTVALNPPPNANAWNNGDVIVTFSCIDSISGVATCPGPVPVTAEGANQIAQGMAVDKAGNTATASVTLNIDKTRPVVTASQSPDANARSWNNGPVVVTFGATDALSGVTPGTLSAPVTLSADGANQSASGQARDLAGNVGSVTRTGINIDQTKPVITLTLSPDPGPGGFVDSAVLAHFTCTDAGGSDVTTCPPDQYVSQEGSNLTVTGTVTDVAGNSAEVTSAPFGIDLTAPTIAVSLSPDLGPGGFAGVAVTAHFACADAGSGVASCPTDQTVSADGLGLTVTGTATDRVGRTASVTSSPFNVDRTPPTITMSLTPEPTGGFLNTTVTAHFDCFDTLSGVAACPPDQMVSNEGTNLTVTGTATDRAGNAASVTSAPFSIDHGAPIITIALTPSPNENGWNKSPVTAHFTCVDAGSGVASCPADQTFSVDGAGQTVTGSVTDRAGNIATASAVVNLDRAPPALTLVSPTNGTTLYASSVTATGTVTDALSGIASATCNSAPATVTGTSVSCGVTLTPGANSISATATDVAGNTSSAMLEVTDVRVPTVTITSPANSSYFNISPTTATGTVDDPNATVTVNSIPASVAADGSFSIALPLAEGPNIITASAGTAAGAAGTASIEVNLDTTPPHVTITSPADQFLTTDAVTSVSGIINDIVVGTVNAEQAGVTVNGVAAQVANRTFLATDVALAIGPNVIQAIGRDRVGNAATTHITVTRQPITRSHIRLISGNNQTGAIGSTLPRLLTLALTDVAGNPVSNKPVMFAVTQNDGVVAATGGAPAVSSVVTTDAQGQSQVQWTLGKRAGAGGNLLEAYAVGFEGTAVFTATGTQGPAGKIVVDTGNDQIGAINQPLPKPLIAVVIDDGNNRLAGVPVTFTVGGGGGSFGGEQTFSVNTDSDGRAAATLTLGLQEGNANNLVSAGFASNEGFPAAFTASGRAPGNPANTTISGVVLDNSNVPIPGVTIRAVLTNVLHSNASATQSAIAAQTDAQGQFSIAPAPVGFVKLLVDGSTAQLPGTYPSLEYDMVTVAGQSNTVGSPIYILPLNTANQLCVTATTGGGTLTIPEAPGFSLTFGPGQVTFPGGSKSGCVSVTVVNGDKVPMVPGFGQQPRFIVTIQPSGAVFNPPAPITLPNVDGLKPREVTEMYSFDHDISSFVAIGTGTVSDDGQVIRSNAGVGVMKAGWHCGGNPQTNGTAATCPDCQICNIDHCITDLTKNGRLTPSGNACCFAGTVRPQHASDYPSLISFCPNRTQDFDLKHSVDGCSIPMLGNDPTDGHFNVSDTSTAFGLDQGDIFENDVKYLPCNNHDLCYQRTGSNKYVCDENLRTEAHQVCERAYPPVCPYAPDVSACANYFIEKAKCDFFADLYANKLESNIGGIPQKSWEDDQVKYSKCCWF